MTSRRAFVALAGLAAALPPASLRAQPAARAYRVGMLLPTAKGSTDPKTAGSLIPAALRELGYVAGGNLVLEQRFAGGQMEQLPAMAQELARIPVDVIVAIGASAVRAATAATKTIPIVLYGNIDPVAAGLVSNLARPEGNVTGVLIAPEGTLAGKKLELLREAVPGVTRIAFLAPGDPGAAGQVREVQRAATALSVVLAVTTVEGRDYARAFAGIAGGRPGALFVAGHTFFVNDRKPVIELAARYRLPAIYEWREHVEDGGLMSYGSSLAATTRRVAVVVDRLLKGAKPGDIPIEQPTSFELAINLRTAKALGLVLPRSLLLRADVVIE